MPIDLPATSTGELRAINESPSFATDNIIQPLAGLIPGLIIKQSAAGNDPPLQFKESTDVVTADYSAAGIRLYGATTGASIVREPTIGLYNYPDGGAAVRKWEMGLDTSNSVNDDFFLARGAGAGVTDIVYLKDDGTDIFVGVGVTPPLVTGNLKARFQVSARDGSAVHGIAVRVGPASTGDAFRVTDSTPNILFRINSDGSIGPPDSNGGVLFKADTTNFRTAMMDKSAGGAQYGFYYSGGGNDVFFRGFTGGFDIWKGASDGAFIHTSTKLGFYNLGTGVTKATVTGAKGGNAALGSLLTALAGYGLITDSSSA